MERFVRIEKKDWRGKIRGEGKGKKEDAAKHALAHVLPVTLSVNVISVGVLWTGVVRRGYCWFCKVLKNIAMVKNLDWQKKQIVLTLSI